MQSVCRLWGGPRGTEGGPAPAGDLPSSSALQVPKDVSKHLQRRLPPTPSQELLALAGGKDQVGSRPAPEAGGGAVVTLAPVCR